MIIYLSKNILESLIFATDGQAVIIKKFLKEKIMKKMRIVLYEVFCILTMFSLLGSLLSFISTFVVSFINENYVHYSINVLVCFGILSLISAGVFDKIKKKTNITSEDD